MYMYMVRSKQIQDSNLIQFFSCHRYWMYFDYRLEEGPLYLTQYGGHDGLPSALENMDAAFIWEKNYKAYFFKGWEYWRYDEISKTVDPGYPKNISIWGKCLVVFVTIEGSSRKKKIDGRSSKEEDI